MVEEQLVRRGIRDARVLAAMRKVPRHLFVEEALQEQAYGDHALPIGERQTISQPFMVALMTEALQLKGDEKVLEIGTGSGYQTAVLAELAATVYTVERVGPLIERAGRRFTALGYRNIRCRQADGSVGWEEAGPFDAILVTAGAPDVPRPLVAQLREGGRLVIPVGSRTTQVLKRIVKVKGSIREAVLTSCVFVPLIGAEGWMPEGAEDPGGRGGRG